VEIGEAFREPFSFFDWALRRESLPAGLARDEAVSELTGALLDALRLDARGVGIFAGRPTGPNAGCAALATLVVRRRRAT